MCPSCYSIRLASASTRAFMSRFNCLKATIAAFDRSTISTVGAQAGLCRSRMTRERKGCCIPTTNTFPTLQQGTTWLGFFIGAYLPCQPLSQHGITSCAPPHPVFLNLRALPARFLVFDSNVLWRTRKFCGALRFDNSTALFVPKIRNSRISAVQLLLE